MLLDAVRNEAGALQQHLAEFIEALPVDHAKGLDMIALQSVDELTQILGDLAAAFQAVARGLDDEAPSNWASIIGQVKLERVRGALTSGGESGRDPTSRRSQVEFF